ncbi:MAG TPA: LL-diaminopimelate aminotransferase [Anaerolineae bacterium]|nr:LL-diaminopimelate aminotransferase [Anaerolineae bacterium]HQJ51739.1 LL-diaminopimelate aminotransferase [Anaerolineae bacterium]
MRVAKRVTDLPAYAFAVAGKQLEEMRARGVDVIDLGIGSPDLPPPAPIIEALYHSAQRADSHGYAGYYGLPALRRAVADYYQRRFAVQVDPNKEVAMLIGSKEGLFNAALAFLDPGNVVLIPDPGYPTYHLGAHMVGAVQYSLPLREERGFLPDLEAIPADVADAARVLWLNYPNNPTGAVADMSFLENAVAFARHHDLLLCYDNPYCDLTFDGYKAPSILEIPGAKDVVLEFNSLSKTYNMAGWRVGMAVGGAEAVNALARVKTNIDSGIFRPIQDAAIQALNGDQSWLLERNAIYQRRRDVVMSWLPAAGLEARVPRAAMYVWARVPAGRTSREFSGQVLEQTGVWITPGPTFGEAGEGYVRIALTLPEDRLREAGDRIHSASLPR